MKLKIAIQKQGKLADGSIGLLRKCGITFANGLGKLKAEAADFPLEIYFLRDDDIPDYVADGVADIGIIGENVLAEHPKSVETIEKLGFGRCRLSIAVPKAGGLNDLKTLSGKKIATSYPNILTCFLRQNSIDAEVHEVNGSVEIAPSVGLADAICDLVSSGSTLFSNGLREAHVVMRSEAVLIARTGLDGEASQLLEQLLFRIRSVKAAEQNKYILLNAPAERVPAISRLLPGMRSPTVVPLAESGWVSLQSVISEHEFWEVCDELKKAGAEGILVVSIDQMIV